MRIMHAVIQTFDGEAHEFRIGTDGVIRIFKDGRQGIQVERGTAGEDLTDDVVSQFTIIPWTAISEANFYSTFPADDDDRLRMGAGAGRDDGEAGGDDERGRDTNEDII